MKKAIRSVTGAALCAAVCLSAAVLPVSAETKDANNPWKNKDVNVQVIEDFSDTSYYKNGKQLREYLNDKGGYDSLVERAFPDFHVTDVKVQDKKLVVTPYESDAIFWNLKKPVSQAEMKKATGIGFYIKNNYGDMMCVAFYGSGANEKKETAMWYYYGLKCTLVDKNFNVTTAKTTYDQVQIPKGFEGWVLFDIGDFVNNNSKKRPKPFMKPGDFTIERVGYRNYGSSTKAASPSKTLIIDDMFLYGKDVPHKQGDIKLPFEKENTGTKPVTSSKPITNNSSRPNTNNSNPNTNTSSLAQTSSSVISSETGSTVEENVGSKVGGTIDGAPADTEFVVTRYTAGAYYDAAGAALADLADKYALYDMKLMQNGATVALTGEVTFKIPGPGGFSRKKLAVYDLTGNTGRGELVFKRGWFTN